jgi:hypothetical protein
VIPQVEMTRDISKLLFLLCVACGVCMVNLFLLNPRSRNGLLKAKRERLMMENFFTTETPQATQRN